MVWFSFNNNGYHFAIEKIEIKNPLRGTFWKGDELSFNMKNKNKSYKTTNTL